MFWLFPSSPLHDMAHTYLILKTCVIFPVSHLCCGNCSLNCFVNNCSFLQLSLRRAAFEQGCFSAFCFGWKVSAVGVILNIRNNLKADWQEPSAQTGLLFSLWQLVSSKVWGLQQAAFTARKQPLRGCSSCSLSASQAPCHTFTEHF